MSLICDPTHNTSMLIDLCLEWLPPFPNKEVKPGTVFSFDSFVGRINKGNIPTRQRKILVG